NVHSVSHRLIHISNRKKLLPVRRYYWMNMSASVHHIAKKLEPPIQLTRWSSSVASLRSSSNLYEHMVSADQRWAAPQNKNSRWLMQTGVLFTELVRTKAFREPPCAPDHGNCDPRSSARLDASTSSGRESPTARYRSRGHLARPSNPPERRN